jgi:branched-chain amino acid transport system substrate-binding protein
VEEAVAEFERFIVEKNLDAVLVGFFRSEALLAGMDAIARRRIPVLGTIAMTAASEEMVMRSRRYRHAFRLGLNSKYLAEYLIGIMKFLKEKHGLDRVYVMNQDVAWTRGAVSMLIKLYLDGSGWEVLGMDVYPSGASDFSKSIERAKQKAAQVLVPVFDMPESEMLVKQWNQAGADMLLSGFISPMVGPGAWTTFGGSIAGALNLVFELGNVPSEAYPPSKDFYEAYHRRYGKAIEAGHGPAPAYEAVFVLAEAIERAGGLEPDALAAELEKTDRSGAMGRIRFHRGHQVVYGTDPQKQSLACAIQWSREGTRRVVYPESIAEGEIELPQRLKAASTLP